LIGINSKLSFNSNLAASFAKLNTRAIKPVSISMFLNPLQRNLFKFLLNFTFAKAGFTVRLIIVEGKGCSKLISFDGYDFRDGTQATSLPVGASFSFDGT